MCFTSYYDHYCNYLSKVCLLSRADTSSSLENQLVWTEQNQNRAKKWPHEWNILFLKMSFTEFYANKNFLKHKQLCSVMSNTKLLEITYFQLINKVLMLQPLLHLAWAFSSAALEVNLNVCILWIVLLAF